MVANNPLNLTGLTQQKFFRYFLPHSPDRCGASPLRLVALLSVAHKGEERSERP